MSETISADDMKTRLMAEDFADQIAVLTERHAIERVRGMQINQENESLKARIGELEEMVATLRAEASVPDPG